MTKQNTPQASLPKVSLSTENRVGSTYRRRRIKRNVEKTDVLISAVVSSYLLTHLHHVLQRAEYGALKEGRSSQAANLAQLRKVLCMDARSMDDASALGISEGDWDSCLEPEIRSNAA